MSEKSDSYFSDIRWDIISLIPQGQNRILEIGCGKGNTGKALKQANKAVEVVGIEIVPEIAQQAQSNIDKVINADIEKSDLPFAAEYFDYIILADILEHLHNPLKLLNEIKRYIKKDGKIIVSLPNIRYWKIVKDLVFKGQWNYTSSGILDDTHLRFFTKNSAMKLFNSAGFNVELAEPRFRLQPKKSDNLINNITLHLFEDFLTMQYIVRAAKTK